MHIPLLLLPSCFYSGSQADYLDDGVFLGLPGASVFLDAGRRFTLDYIYQDYPGGASPPRQ